MQEVFDIKINEINYHVTLRMILHKSAYSGFEIKVSFNPSYKGWSDYWLPVKNNKVNVYSKAGFSLEFKNRCESFLEKFLKLKAFI